MPSARSSSTVRRRFALVGVGARSRMFQQALQARYRSTCELVALCDSNPGRLELARQQSREHDATIPPGYAPADFERMIAETRPDAVVVTSLDATHDDYIVRALDAGCDVISEKPMTTTAEKCRRILEAKKRTGRNVRVTFNYRYSPPRSQVKDLLMSGAIGDVLSVDFHWLLNTHHGADYFRRWHTDKANSGGLIVHKATHHFDLVNWWLGAMPVAVLAAGKREFYTPATARRLGLSGPHERCHTCPEKAKCSFALDLAGAPQLKALYLDQEKYDGYWRDRCVFRPGIGIEDTMNAIVRYDTGATLSYSLNTFNAWEGYQVAFNGTQGRLEHSIVESSYVSGVDAVQGGIVKGGVIVRLIPLRGAAHDLEPWTADGSHGGGDELMLDDLLNPEAPADKYRRAADERAGAASILVGIAANEGMRTGREVRVDELMPDLPRPDGAPMPTRETPLAMPPHIARD